MINIRHLRLLFPYRLLVCFKLLVKKVRLHPSAVLNGPLRKFTFGEGVKIGSRSRLSVASSGEILIEEGVWLSHDVEMETASRIFIGRDTTIQRRATINGTVSLGAGCIIAPNVFISSGTHPFRVYPEKTIREQEKLIVAEKGDLSSLDRPVTIGKDCWLGVNVVICPGVKIGDGCVIGANSVVVKDVPENSVYAGVPAKRIGRRIE